MATAAAEPAVPYAMDIAAPLTEKKGILGRGHEWYPVVGLTLTAAVTQEWWIVDEYWVIGAAFFPAVYSLWLSSVDRMEASERTKWENTIENHRAHIGIAIDSLQNMKDLESFALGHAADLRALFDEEKIVNARAVEYINLKQHADAHGMVTARLKMISNLEADTRARAVHAISTKAAEFVTAKYREAPAAVKNKAVDSAIANITSDFSATWGFKASLAWREVKADVVPLAANDPVRLLFDEFLAQRHTPQTLGVVDSVQRLFNREAAEAAKKAATPAAAAGAAPAAH